jgi:Rieske Fe-S protein
MTAQQVLVIAIPLLAAVFVLFVVLVVSSRREKTTEEETETLKDRFEEALQAVPGGVAPEKVVAESASVAAAAQAAPPTAVGTEQAAVITETRPPIERLGEEPSGDGHKAVQQIVSPKIELKPLEQAVDEETEGMTRRQILNRGILLTIGASLTSFGGAILAFLWPKLSGGFGSVIAAGNIDEIKSAIKTNREPFYSAAGRFYLMTYDTNLDEAAGDAVYPKVFADFKQAGLIAMYQKCPHLGCKVPWCKSSQWFECPCHGSKYNSAGEWQGGPAPRGMWHFPIKVQGGTVMVDTGKQITGPPKGTNTPVDPLPKGPHCVGI